MTRSDATGPDAQPPGRPLPWQGGGRPLPGGAPDDGAADGRLGAALAAHDGEPATRAEVLAALAGARVFVAVRASGPGGSSGDAGAEMSLVCLRSEEGVLAVPVFSDGHAVQRWQADARPVPLPGPEACGAARDQGASVLLLDPDGAAFVATAGELRALAEGYVPVAGSGGLASRHAETALTEPAAVDPVLLQALADALRDEPVTAARLLEGPGGLVLGLAGPDLGPAGLTALAARLLDRTRTALPPAGLDVARVDDDGPGLVVPLARRRGLLRRGR